MKPLYILFFLLNAIIIRGYSQEQGILFRTGWEKGKTHLNLSIPLINYSLQSPPSKIFEQVSVFGFSIGGDYCYSDRSFLSLQIGIANAGPLSERFPDTSGWEYQQSALCFYANVRNSHVVKQFDIGYGPAVGCNMFKEGSYNDKLRIDSVYSYQNWSVGIAASTYIRILHFLYAGVQYQPQFFSLTTGKFQYEHLLSCDVLFRLNHRNKENH